MRKKIFTFLFALMASVGMSWAAGIPCTAADRGKVLCTDGSIYATVSEATAASKTAVAMIAYIDTENNKGLALALVEESGNINWSNAIATCAAKTPTVTGGTWKLASEDEWTKIVNAAGGRNALRDGFSAIGGTNLSSGGNDKYWSSTESSNTEKGRCISFNDTFGGWKDATKTATYPYYARACLAFNIGEPTVTTHTLQLHVNDALMGSLALQNPSNDIVDNGDGTYTVPEGAEVTLHATPNDGYEFIGWKASSSICDFNDCEFTALPTVENPLTVDMYMTAAFMAEFAAVAPQPQPEIGPKEVLDLGTTGCVGEHYQLTGGGTGIYRTVGGVGDKMITIESLHGEIIDNISLKLYYYNVWTGYSVAASSGDVSSWNYDAYEDLVITNINATSVTLSRVGSGQENGYVMFEKVTINNSDEPTPQPEPEPEGDGKLTGAFTINADGDQIVFSKGNLQYQASTTTWRFATNQYDLIGDDNINISDTYTGWIDLFGWGTGDCPTKKSTVDEDYSTFTDWGVNAISNGGNEANLWRTLTGKEWNYLTKTRTNAADLKGQATVAGVHGYVLLPDSWTLPAGLSFTASPNDWTTNDYTAEQWAQMEAAGAVFLPAAGYHNGSSILQVGARGEYWASDAVTDIAAYYFAFYETTAYRDGGRFYFGHTVRLVTAYDAPTPTPAVVIGDPNDASEVETFLSTYDGQTIDELIIDRPVLNNMYNTLCLPFDMNAAQIAASSLNGVEIREFTGASVEGTTLNLSVGDPVNAVVAGRPYFVKYSAASQLDDLHFEDVTIDNAILDNMAVTFDGVTFKGTFTPFVMPNGLNFQGGYLFLGQNNQLFWPNTSNPLKPFRAYFYVDVESSTPGNAPKYRGMPARIVEGKNVATGVENAQSANQSTKVIVNGQLIIIKNDVRYNAQGQIVK